FLLSPQINPKFQVVFMNLPITLKAPRFIDMYDRQGEQLIKAILNNRGKAEFKSAHTLAAFLNETMAKYPPLLSGVVHEAAFLIAEKNRLQAILEQQETEGVVNHDESPVFTWQIDNEIRRLDSEIDDINRRVFGHHRFCRTIALAQAEFLGANWPDYLISLGAALYFSEHALADLNLALNDFMKAGGSDLGAATTLYEALKFLADECDNLKLPMEFQEKWGADLFPSGFILLGPSLKNFNDWLNCVHPQALKLKGQLEKLKWASLGALLEAEGKVETYWQKAPINSDGPPCPMAPPPLDGAIYEPRSPAPVESLRVYSAAERLNTGFGRSALAILVLLFLAWQGHYLAHSRVFVYNGLGTQMLVQMGDKKLLLAPHSHGLLRQPSGRIYEIRASSDGLLLESFRQRLIPKPTIEVYNIGGGAPLAMWRGRPGTRLTLETGHFLGRPRWLISPADIFFRQMPRLGFGQRLVLNSYGDIQPDILLGMLTTFEDRQDLIRLQAVWNNGQSPWSARWRELYLVAP
ncbi:MAG: hypothetical protein ACRCTY_02975, partial [Candidatus Adiutrix sp.]